MDRSTILVLVVDDYQPWRRLICSTLRKRVELVVCEASDGLEAVQRTRELQPDLILLDIGLPALNGIEAARQILALTPKTRILFLSENRSPGIAEAALCTGAKGYVVKSDAAKDLLPAIAAVLRGEDFVSAILGASLRHSPTPRFSAEVERREPSKNADPGTQPGRAS